MFPRRLGKIPVRLGMFLSGSGSSRLIRRLNRFAPVVGHRKIPRFPPSENRVLFLHDVAGKSRKLAEAKTR